MKEYKRNGRTNFYSAKLVILFVISMGIVSCDNMRTVGRPGFTEGEVERVSFAVADGIPYVAYRDKVHDNKATVMRYTGKKWEVVGKPGFSEDPVSSISIAIKEGSPYVAYNLPREEDGKLMIKRYKGFEWESIDTTGLPDKVMPFCFTIDEGILYVALYNEKGLMVKRYTGQRWEDTGDMVAAKSPSAVSLVVNKGIPFVSYREDIEGAFGGEPVVKRYNGKVWETLDQEGFSGLEVFFLSLAVDNGIPYVVYNNVNTNNVTVKKFNGKKWEIVGDDDLSCALHFSIVVYNGIPYVAYIEIPGVATRTHIDVCKFDGEKWIYLSKRPLFFYFEKVVEEYVLLAVDNGIPYVAFLDPRYGFKLTVGKYDVEK